MSEESKNTTITNEAHHAWAKTIFSLNRNEVIVYCGSISTENLEIVREVLAAEERYSHAALVRDILNDR